MATNNQRVPGGFAYEPNRQTTIDVRGDIQTLDQVRELADHCPASRRRKSHRPAGASRELYGGLSSLAGHVNPWTASNAVTRVGDVADVVAGYEPRSRYAHISGKPGCSSPVQKAATASEVDASNNVLRALPQIERQFPRSASASSTSQSKFTQQQIDIVTRTLCRAILLTGIAMLFFLRSWRSAIVVCISIPTSLAIAITAMKLMHLTIDTISLLGMSLVIGILVDDSTVVLENIERHFTELKQTPEDAAVDGREEIGAAAVVITLVDVVVFLPDRVHSRPGRAQPLGVRDRRRDLDAHLALRLVHGHADARRPVGAALAVEAVARSSTRSAEDFDDVRSWYTQRALPWASNTAGSSRSSARGTFVGCDCARPAWASSARSSSRRPIAARSSSS